MKAKSSHKWGGRGVFFLQKKAKWGKRKTDRAVHKYIGAECIPFDDPPKEIDCQPSGWKHNKKIS